MSGGRLQHVVDRLLGASRQRWILGTAAMMAGVTASGVATDWSAPPIVWGVLALALVVATSQPDSHAGLVVVVVVVWQWLVTVDDPTTPGAVAVALALLLFHSLLALMAVTPETAVVDRDILRRWLGRGAVVAGGTAGVWVLVAVLDRRNAPGSALLTLAAFVVVTVVVVVLRRRSVDAGDGR